jgi:hypothetical protein
MVLFAFFVVAVLWLFVVYLPGRTLERWEGSGRGKAGPAADSGSPDESLKPES